MTRRGWQVPGVAGRRTLPEAGAKNAKGLQQSKLGGLNREKAAMIAGRRCWALLSPVSQTWKMRPREVKQLAPKAPELEEGPGFPPGRLAPELSNHSGREGESTQQPKC